VWCVIVVSLVGIFYGLLGMGAALVARALFLAHVRGNGVRISPRQLPELYARIAAVASRLGIDPVPDVYLLQSDGVLNAFATKLLSRRFVILYSSLVDACEDPRQLDFIIAHELGHFAAGHLALNTFLAPFRVMPLLGAAYSRAKEYTCDRCGFAVVGDLEPSTRALAILASGGKHAAEIDLAAFEEQRLETGSFVMSLAELGAGHPFLCKRAAALRDFSRPGTVEPVRRNALAYLFAPFVPTHGGVAAPLLLAAFVAGLLVAANGRHTPRRTTAGRDTGAAGLFSGHADR
jgi:Zn-dependent protease with chaperone function